MNKTSRLLNNHTIPAHFAAALCAVRGIAMAVVYGNGLCLTRIMLHAQSCL
ncbi:MAG: hypothetical protein HY789_01305 [Deltaproteobacteria bacterium]|nr:hypothetical protein [Deltaproteobacteria bacterium]